jgi:hypothetical protein
MDSLLGFELNVLPIRNLKKIEDLLEYDGPILSHFIDSFENNYLFYWVDSDSYFNRWLIWNVSLEQLAGYILGEVSLQSLFYKNLEHCYYSVDIDENVEYHNIHLLRTQEVPLDYIPGDNSFYLIEADKSYLEYVKNKMPSSKHLEFESAFHNASLKKNAIYIKLEQRFGDQQPVNETPVNSLDAGALLDGLSKSFKEYFGFFSNKILKSKILNPDKLKTQTELIKNSIELKIVDMQFASFGIAVSPDHILLNNPYVDVNFTISTFNDYKNDVLELDFNNLNQLNRINEIFDESTRWKIYDPILKVVSKDKNVVSITNKSFKKLKVLKNINSANRSILLPPTSKVIKQEEVAIETRIAEVKVNPQTNKIQTSSASLFDPEMHPAYITNEIVSLKNGINYQLNKQLTFVYHKSNDIEYLEEEFLGIYASGETFNDVREMVAEEFDYMYTRYNSLNDDQLTDDVKLLKNFLNSIVIK